MQAVIAIRSLILLTPVCPRTIRQANSADLTKCVCLKLNGMQVCALSLGKASMLSLDLVLKITHGDRL